MMNRYLFADKLKQGGDIQAKTDMWAKIYKEFFGKPVVIVNVSEDGPEQRGGVDHWVVTDEKSKKLIPIDTKADFYVSKNICVELWSDVHRKKPGWACKPMQCDYIAYYFVKCGEVYMIPHDRLLKTTKKKLKSWKRHGRIIRVASNNWVGESVLVPKELFIKDMKLAKNIIQVQVEDT